MMFTEAQQHEIDAFRASFPFRIIYAAISPSGEFRCNAVVTMHQPNRLAREGWTVYRIR